MRTRRTLLIVKNRLFRFENCAGVRRSRPTLRSATAPVALWYLVNASTPHVSHTARRTATETGKEDVPDAMRVSVVPVSTMPAVRDRMLVDAPYLIDWSMPTNSFAGAVEVIGLSKGLSIATCTGTTDETGNVHEFEFARELAWVDASESELAVLIVQGCRWLEGNANLVCGDGALTEGVVGDSRDAIVQSRYKSS